MQISRLKELRLIVAAHRRSWARRLLTVSVFALATPAQMPGQTPTWRPGAPLASAGTPLGRGPDLYEIRGAARLVDGTLAVLSAGTHSIELFDAEGRHLRSVGRQGAGPGEFLYPEAVRFDPAGGAVVADRDAQRVTVFDPDWKIAREISVPYSASRWPMPSHGAPLTGGQIAVASLSVTLRDAVQREEGTYEDSILLEVIGDGEVLFSLRLAGRAFLAKVGGMSLRKPIPFGPEPLWTSGEDRIVVGDSHDDVFEAFDSVGVPIGEYRMHGTKSRPSREHWAHYQQELRAEYDRPLMLGRGFSQDRGPQVERFLSAAPRGDVLPSFDYLYVDREARLWAREYSLPGEVSWWQVGSVAGGVLGRVPLPWGAEVLDAGFRHVVTLERDDFGVEVVRVYPISP